MRRLGFGLSRELWLVQVGIFLNTFGWGAVLPFEVIYLHDGRGFSLGLAGLVVGTLTGVAVVSAPLAGPLIDRFGARTVAAVAGLALAAGYAGLAFAQTPAAAFAAATLAGAGNGALGPAQSTLLAALAPSELRHRATAVSRVCTNVGFGLGGAVGGFVAASGLNGLIALFLVNAASYLLYVGVLLAVVRESPPAEHVPGGYRVVLRDRPFLHLALTNVAIIAVGWGVLPWLVPPYATSEIGIDAQLIGLLMLANAATVVVAQVPIAKAAEGRRRVVMIALGSSIFAGSCLLVVVAGATPSAAYLTLVLASVAIGVGECFHSAALMPLVAELAPAGLRGRYMATIGLSWWIGLAVAPTAGAQVLSLSPAVAFLGAGAVALTAAGSALALERELPAQARVTPQPG
ncbi:MAG TPA: MFS transporter [Gaiellaceae bacterium]|nr:MFS transporter [Gaiellaceae bacterium]